MPTDLIRYDLLVQDALKGVVRHVLAETAREGLHGEHHFCITFRTRAAGVKLSPRIKEKHPDEMTIILQHQFWDLLVTEQAFEVGLSFGSVPERLVVPFEAVTGFWDPAVQFGLKFEIQDDSPQAGANDAAPLPLEEKETAKPAPKATFAKAVESGERPPAESVAKPRPPKQPAPSKPAASARPADEPTPSANAGDKVVSIDAFRKKP
jgi:hypothetical protein